MLLIFRPPFQRSYLQPASPEASAAASAGSGWLTDELASSQPYEAATSAVVQAEIQVSPFVAFMP